MWISDLVLVRYFGYSLLFCIISEVVLNKTDNLMTSPKKLLEMSKGPGLRSLGYSDREVPFLLWS